MFVCRHGAAKSVLAAARLDRLARAAGAAIEVQAAGIEPDPEVSPAVISILDDAGAWPLQRPREVTADDVARAWRIITFDLQPSEVPAGSSSLERWDGLPPASEDPARTLSALEPRLRRLLDELVTSSTTSNTPTIP